MNAPHPAPKSVTPDRPRQVVLLGNPNVGKTSLFNHLTGLQARVGNYPGITVDRKVGRIRSALREDGRDDVPFELIDAPGTYSLCARSAEEQLTLWEVLGREGLSPPDALIVVVDAGQLARCLYLTAQLLELRIPLVVALNMVDETDGAEGLSEKLARELGVPVVPTNGRAGRGLAELVAAVERILDDAKPFVPRFHVHYDAALRLVADRIAASLPPDWRGSVERDRALALWALSSIAEDDELVGIPPDLRQRVLEVQREGLDVDLLVTQARYSAIEALLEKTGDRPAVRRLSATLAADRILLHPVLGLLVFVVAMCAVFQTLFSWADPAISLLEDAVALTQEWSSSLLPESILRDLFTEGILGGVGNVIVFLPQILLLFFFVGVLEDSGYMARIAYLMDRIMQTLGLHGRAFVPMLSGFACAIPAILATRTLERKRDRLLTMMVVPLMTCSARLPVYSLIIAAIFPVGQEGGLPVQGLLLLAMYVLSLVTGLCAAWVLNRTVVRGQAVPLLLELPPYRLPRLLPTLLMMRQRAGEFLKEAGTVILAATVVLWALLYFPRTPSDPNESGHAQSPAAQLESSYGGRIGHAIEPLVAPLGFDWKIATGILGAFAAREVFVSTMALVYGVDDTDDALPLRDKIRAEKRADGSPTFTPAVGLSLMVFFAFACQCMSTLAVVHRETKSWRWPAFLFTYMTALAYLASFVVFQTARWLGH